MKTILRVWLLCLVIGSFPVSRSLAAPGWFWQNPLPQGNPLLSVFVFDTNTVIGVGDAGRVIKTTDGGLSWAVQGAAGGTTDGGATWTPQNSGTTAFLESLLGGCEHGDGRGLRFRDRDGSDPADDGRGATWTPQGSGTNILWEVSFVDANAGTAVGDYGTILRTSDGGTTWTPQGSGTFNSLYGVSFADANTGTAVGSSGTILHTTDGGATWTPQSSGTTDGLAGVSFVDANTGTVVGLYGTILRTNTGGVNNPDGSNKVSVLAGNGRGPSRIR